MNLDLRKLKIAQAKACLSTNDIVEQTKLGRSTVSKIFNGSTEPSTKSAGLIAKALNVDITELLLD
ncbi:XRE family transcriptional regulator [Clostridium botulinum]|uniref:XRE family transcriptional regulator n=1 Tax=Clostridium botulinum TaxID=1491 RepID=A0A6M0SRZ0_CLOBO|nr:XRE family transcriptional regulator [Clostridium botulinum]